jgi:hypothetical protein
MKGADTMGTDAPLNEMSGQTVQSGQTIKNQSAQTDTPQVMAGQPTQTMGQNQAEISNGASGPHYVDPNKKNIVKVRKTGRNISHVMFQDGSVVDVNTAIDMAEKDLINDVNSGSTRTGHKTLKSYPDGNPDNNLGSLPQF